MPPLRDKIAETKKIPFPRPSLDEQELEILERRLSRTLGTGAWIKLMLWSYEGPREKEVTILRQEGSRYLRCLDQEGAPVRIPLANILEVRN